MAAPMRAADDSAPVEVVDVLLVLPSARFQQHDINPLARELERYCKARRAGADDTDVRVQHARNLIAIEIFDHSNGPGLVY
jgi:hypothetical protein